MAKPQYLNAYTGEVTYSHNYAMEWLRDGCKVDLYRKDGTYVTSWLPSEYQDNLTVKQNEVIWLLKYYKVRTFGDFCAFMANVVSNWHPVWRKEFMSLFFKTYQAIPSLS